MTETHSLRVADLALAYGDRSIIDGLSLAVPPGQITAIIGPNGCGKSTLLRALARLLKPRSGAVLLDEHELHRLPTREVARTIGLLPQSPIAPEGITVGDLVARGRHPHQRAFARLNAADNAAIERALAATDTTVLADRAVDELSGGQRQRVWIALALAQETDVLLLDEPTTFLDLAHQVEVLDLLTDLNRERGTTLAMVLHDINLAARYADHLIALRDGAVVAAGDPREIVTPEFMRDVFDLDCVVVTDPVSGGPAVLPRGRHHDRPRTIAPSTPDPEATP